MKLETYLESRRLSQKEFGHLVKLSQQTLSNYIAGRRKPSLDAAKRIEEATKGKVTMEDLLDHWNAKNS